MNNTDHITKVQYSFGKSWNHVDQRLKTVWHQHTSMTLLPPWAGPCVLPHSLRQWQKASGIHPASEKPLIQWCALATRGSSLSETMCGWILWVKADLHEDQDSGCSTRTLCCRLMSSASSASDLNVWQFSVYLVVEELWPKPITWVKTQSDYHV